GNLVIFQTVSGHWMERLERAAAVEFGGSACSTEFSMTAAQARGATVRDSVSLAIRIGKVLDVERRTTSGFARGSVVIEGLGVDTGRLIRLELQNENLVALERGHVLASVPDLITVLDSETAGAIATERIAYGQRVTVIAFCCDPVWRTGEGIAVAGPRAF